MVEGHDNHPSTAAHKEVGEMLFKEMTGQLRPAGV